MGKRATWEFRFTQEQLLFACDERILVHRRRIEALLWDLRKKNDYRLELLCLWDTQPLESHTTTLLQQEMNALQARVEKHKQMEREYLDWRRLFSLGDSQTTYLLTYEDVAYFFDHIGDQDEAEIGTENAPA
jgi:hypothetical protein